MSGFKMHREVSVLPKIIEVEGIIFKNYPNSTPVPTLSNTKGIIYNGNGFLIYRGPGGTLTTVANS
jgi:hypothetical protein